MLSTTSLSFSNSSLFILELLCLYIIFHAHKILNFLTKNLNTIWPKFCFFFIIFINPLKIGLKKKIDVFEFNWIGVKRKPEIGVLPFYRFFVWIYCVYSVPDRPWTTYDLYYWIDFWSTCYANKVIWQNLSKSCFKPKKEDKCII